jgi:two-component system, LytTR family, sensor kinase
MKKNWSLNNSFFQFLLFIILNTSFSILTFLILKLLEFGPPNPSEPLGAPSSFILYNNFLKGLLVVVVLYFFGNSRAAIPNSFFRYFMLALIIYFANGVMQAGVALMLNKSVDFGSILWSPAGAMVFRVITVLAALVVYRWSMKQEKREVDELNRRLELSTLRELKTKAELDGLHARVNPHFLYNSLNSIYTLIDQHPEKAKEMIMLLSKLFRLTVNGNDDHYVRVREELDLVRTYLAIEKVRFGEKLQVEVKCNDALLDTLIPRFILQPLVENAIKHGTSRISNVGHIQIVITENDNFIEMQVRDNGPAFKHDLQNGYGLQSVSEKIRLLGGEGAHMEIVGDTDEVPPVAGPWKYVGLKLRKRESINS